WDRMPGRLSEVRGHNVHANSSDAFRHPDRECSRSGCYSQRHPGDLVKKRIAVIGAGLCGSVVSALLRNSFDVTVIEQGKRRRPLFDDVECPAGDVNTSINRAEGLGGTTAYWHNALMELTAADLRRAGIASDCLEPYYSKAWAFFLDDDERSACRL